MKFSYVTLPDYPLEESLEHDQGGRPARVLRVLSVDETWHKDLYILFAAAAPTTKHIRFGPSLAPIGVAGADADLPSRRYARRANRWPG